MRASKSALPDLGFSLECGDLQGHIQEITVVVPRLDSQSLHLEEMAGVLDLEDEIDQLGQGHVVDPQLYDALVVAVVQRDLLRLHRTDVFPDVLLVGQVFDEGEQGRIPSPSGPASP